MSTSVRIEIEVPEGHHWESEAMVLVVGNDYEEVTAQRDEHGVFRASLPVERASDYDGVSNLDDGNPFVPAN